MSRNPIEEVGPGDQPYHALAQIPNLTASDYLKTETNP